jgi:hypothetical protein
MSSDREALSASPATRRRLLASLARIAVIVVTAAILPRWWCGRGAAAWLADDVAAQRALGDVVAARASRGVSPNGLHTGSAQFDGEWSLVTNQMTALGLGQIVLAHRSERERYLPAIESAVSHALTTDARAFGTALWSEDGLATLESDHGHAYLGYLAMAMAMQRLVDPRPNAERSALLDALVASLERRLRAAPHAIIETYPDTAFPADTASVVGAIGLYALATHTDHRDTIQHWVTAFRRDCIDRATGFVDQTIDPISGRATGSPRGSGTALVAYFVSFADPSLARDLETAMHDRGLRTFAGFGGVREYPGEQDRGAGDIDSGPVVLGVSVSATGFALGSAHRFHDAGMFTSLYRTASLFGIPYAHDGARSYLVGAGLGDAILLAMMTAREMPR